MKYNIVFKEDSLTKEIKNKLIKKLKGTIDVDNPEIVFTIGGDGTVLDAVRKYIHILDRVKLIAINTGNIGFYTEFLPEELDLIINLINTDIPTISYSLIEFNIDDTVNYALNEVVFSVNHHLFEGTIELDNIKLMNVRSDGICISTPTGSTAYNKSLKGAVVDPTIEAMQLVVIAPFETLDKRVVSPLILNKDKEVVIKPKNNYFDVSFDRNFVTYQNIEQIKVRLSNKKVNFIKNERQNFPKRLKEKFIS